MLFQVTFACCAVNTVSSDRGDPRKAALTRLKTTSTRYQPTVYKFSYTVYKGQHGLPFRNVRYVALIGIKFGSRTQLLSVLSAVSGIEQRGALLYDHIRKTSAAVAIHPVAWAQTKGNAGPLPAVWCTPGGAFTVVC